MAYQSNLRQIAAPTSGNYVVSADRMRELLSPFVGARLRGDETASVTIGYPGCRANDADIRGVDADGIEYVFIQTQHVAWADVRYIVIRCGGREDTYQIEADAVGVAA